MTSSQYIAVGVRPIIKCVPYPDSSDICSFDHWELDNSVLSIVKPEYTPLPLLGEGNSFRIEQPSPSVAGTYKCYYSCNSGANIMASELLLSFYREWSQRSILISYVNAFLYLRFLRPPPPPSSLSLLPSHSHR